MMSDTNVPSNPFQGETQEPSERIYALFNDKFTSGTTDPGSTTFHPFPRLPVELRLKIWAHCLPSARFLSVHLTAPHPMSVPPRAPNEPRRLDYTDEDAIRRHKRRPLAKFDRGANHLGRIVSGGGYSVMVPPIVGSRSASAKAGDPGGCAMQYVNREARGVYIEFYLLRD